MLLSPMMDVKSSGAELPAAMNVAPATSSLRWRRCEKSAHKEQKEKVHCCMSANLILKRSTGREKNLAESFHTSHSFSREGTK